VVEGNGDGKVVNIVVCMGGEKGVVDIGIGGVGVCPVVTEIRGEP